MEAARFVAMANNMIKNNKAGKFDQYLSFEWDKKQSKSSTKAPTIDQAKRIVEFYNKIWSNSASSRN